MTENLPELMIDINPQIQEAQQIPIQWRYLQRIYTSAHYHETLRHQRQTDHLSNSKSIYKEFSSATLGSQKTTDSLWCRKKITVNIDFYIK